MHRIAILTYNQAALFELGCAVELFALARPEFSDWYRCDVVSFDTGMLNATGGVQLQAKHVDSLAAYHTLVVPSWPTDNPVIAPQLAAQVLTFHRAGKRILSFCSGAFLLAQLGLLNERNATTHWRYADKFKTRFPRVHYVDDVLYVYDGHIGCSAGSAAAIDLGIAVIRDDYGYRVANQVARRLVMSAHRQGGQSQFVETPVLATPNQFAAALDWALNNLLQPIDVDTLARRANMSRRTFDRKFRSTFNLTPKAWLVAQRINKAKQLLESEQLAIEQVAERSGFDNAITMRHHFRRQLGVSPRQYRAQFSAGQQQAVG